MAKTVEANCRLVAENEGLTNFTIETKKGSEKGDNFLGEITMVTVGERRGPKRLNLIAKRAIQNPLVREKYPIRETYKNEIFAYDVLHPLLDDLQRDIDNERKFSAIPKCYYTSMDAGEEMLILENLQSIGYQMHDKTVLLDGEQIGKIFETYGKFHALSFALKEKRPEQYDEMRGALRDIYIKFFEADDNFSFSLRSTFEYFCDKFEDRSRAIEVARKYSEDAGDIFKQLLLEEDDFFCITHGDCWSNNMLFKYTDEGTLDKICLIDWQLARVGSPACDLSYVLYSGASKSVLDDYEKYLKIYHESLSSMLTELKCDVQNLYPYHILKEHWKKYAKFGLCMGIMILTIKYTKKEEIIDYSDVKTSDEKELQEALKKMAHDDSKLVPAVTDILNHLINIDCI